jgi:hypothetical protein
LISSERRTRAAANVSRAVVVVESRLTLYRYPGTSSGLSVSSSGQSLIQIASARDYGPYR